MENVQANSSDCKNAIIQELLTGRDLAKQLLQVVGNDEEELEYSLLIIRPFVEDLVKKILRSFTNTLFLFNTTTSTSTNNIPLITHSSPKSDKKSLDHASCKSFNTRNSRGCYKRKRNIETWEKDSPVLVEDGHAWRKYGQKLTRNTKYLRNYYRCSHKYEEGCEAMKQVQRIQEKPPLFRTTYYGLHTCNNNINLTDLDPSDSSNSILISFNNTRNNNNYATQHDHPFVSSSSSTTKSKTKKEDNININKELDDHITILDDDIVQEQNTMPQYEEHVAATLSSPSTFDLFSSVKLESFDQVDDVILRCFDFDEFVRFGI